MSKAILLQAVPESFQLDTLYTRLHLQEEEDRREFRELAHTVEKLGRPRALVLECHPERPHPDKLRIGNVTFQGKVFAACCGNLDRVFLYCATCGPETRPLENGLDVFQRYWLDQLRLEQLKASLRGIADYLKNNHGIERFSSLGPGTGAADLWPLNELDKLFFLLGKNKYLAPLGVELTDSMLMLPEKTSAGLYYASTTDFHSCQLCQRENCPSRKVAFNAEMWNKTI